MRRQGWLWRAQVASLALTSPPPHLSLALALLPPRPRPVANAPYDPPILPTFYAPHRCGFGSTSELDPGTNPLTLLTFDSRFQT